MVWIVSTIITIKYTGGAPTFAERKVIKTIYFQENKEKQQNVDLLLLHF